MSTDSHASAERVLRELVDRNLVDPDEAARVSREEDGVLHLLQSLVQENRLTTSEYVRLFEMASSGSASGVSGDPRHEELEGTFGPYAILEELGRGGMGVVYRAVHRPSGGERALKVMLRPGRERSRARFEREGEAAGRLDHPGIVAVRETGELEGLPWIAMEYVEGTPLDDLVEEDALTVDEAVELVARVAEAVDHGHRRGVVHRDLKPQNILVEADGTPRITDFGLARDLGRMTRLTRTGASLGTPYYMAPEQADGRTKEADARTDIYALGVILHQLLTGEVPFRAGNVVELCDLITSVDPPSITAANPAVPRPVEEVVRRAMAKDPARRPGTAAELAADLRRALDGGGVPAGPRRRDRPRGLLVAGVVAGALALVLGAYALTVGTGDPAAGDGGDGEETAAGEDRSPRPTPTPEPADEPGPDPTATDPGTGSPDPSPGSESDEADRRVDEASWTAEIALRLLGDDDLEGARRRAERALELDPDCGLARAVLGRVLLRRDRLADALDELRRAGREPRPADPTRVDLWRALAVREATGDHERVAEILDGYLEAGGEVAGRGTNYRVGIAYRAADRTEEARRFLREAGRLDQPPSVWQIWFNLAGSTPDPGRSIGIYTTAIEAARRAGAPPFWPLVRRGDSHLKLGSWSDARRDYERALRIEAREDDPWPGYGLALWRLGEAEEARRAFDRAVRQAESDAALTRVRRTRAFLHLEAGRWSAARADLGAVLEERPDDEVARAAREALASFEAGRGERARSILRPVAEDRPVHSGVRTWWDRTGE